MQRDDVVVQDIINAAKLVVDFVKGFDKDTSFRIRKPAPLSFIN